MSDEKPLEDPTDCVVSVFDNHGQAEAAKSDLVELGFPAGQIHVLRGEQAAADVDTANKWFADTNIEIRRYERELQAGHTVISVPVESIAEREQVHAALKERGARLVTHFGQWITETMK